MKSHKETEKEYLPFALRLLAKSSLIIFIGVFLSKVLTYIYRIALARYFDAEVFGLFSLALMISMFFIAAAGLGLADGALRYFSLYHERNEKKAQYVYRLSLRILLITGIAASLLLFLLADYISNKIFHN